MNNCPKCGAEKVDQEGSCDIDFACGSHLKNGNPDRFRSGGFCAELCHLRESVAWLERWRATLMWMRVNRRDEYGIACVVSEPCRFDRLVKTTWYEQNKEAIDAAARKEMEAKQ
jgi:hypothetical protein